MCTRGMSAANVFDGLWTHSNALSAAQRQERVFLRVYNGCHRMSRSASNERRTIFLVTLSPSTFHDTFELLRLIKYPFMSLQIATHGHARNCPRLNGRCLTLTFLSLFALCSYTVIRYSLFAAVLTLKGGIPIYIRSNGSSFCFLDGNGDRSNRQPPRASVNILRNSTLLS